MIMKFIKITRLVAITVAPPFIPINEIAR